MAQLPDLIPSAVVVRLVPKMLTAVNITDSVQESGSKTIPMAKIPAGTREIPSRIPATVLHLPAAANGLLLPILDSTSLLPAAEADGLLLPVAEDKNLKIILPLRRFVP
jgi:hypothetical protein